MSEILPERDDLNYWQDCWDCDGAGIIEYGLEEADHKCEKCYGDVGWWITEERDIVEP